MNILQRCILKDGIHSGRQRIPLCNTLLNGEVLRSLAIDQHTTPFMQGYLHCYMLMTLLALCPSLMAYRETL